MKIARRDMWLVILLYGGIGVLLGVLYESTGGMMDFKAVYYAARTLVHHGNPYNPVDLKSLYLSEGGKLPADPLILERMNQGFFVCINMPTSLLLVAPFALLPWGPAHLLWLILIAGGFLTAAYLVLKFAGQIAPGPSILLIAILLIDLCSLIGLGNLAGIVASLCVFAVWSLLYNRHPWAGVVCLALALGLKPHDAGFLWFYFLLVGGMQRKRALQAMLLTVALAIPAVLWVANAAPSWRRDLRDDIAISVARGNLNDPGPTSLTFNGPDAPINMQVVFSIYRDDPAFYNRWSYVVCGLLFLVATVLVLRLRFSVDTAWYAIAGFAALSMLPVYHRGHDAKLLLVAIPACALLWREKGKPRWLGFLLALAAIGATAELPEVILERAFRHLASHMSQHLALCVPLVLAQLAPLSLLALGVFQLWVFWRRSRFDEAQPKIVSAPIVVQSA